MMGLGCSPCAETVPFFRAVTCCCCAVLCAEAAVSFRAGLCLVRSGGDSRLSVHPDSPEWPPGVSNVGRRHSGPLCTGRRTGRRGTPSSLLHHLLPSRSACSDIRSLSVCPILFHFFHVLCFASLSCPPLCFLDVD